MMTKEEKITLLSKLIKQAAADGEITIGSYPNDTRLFNIKDAELKSLASLVIEDIELFKLDFLGA